MSEATPVVMTTPSAEAPDPLALSREGGDQLPLRALASRSPLVMPPATTLREVLYAISQGREDAVVVTDTASGLPLGLVTLRQLLHLLTFAATDLDAPVAAFMIGAPLTLAAESPAHRAKVLMAKKGVGHILLVEPDGRFCGLIHQADILGLRAGGAEELIGAIAAARIIRPWPPSPARSGAAARSSSAPAWGWRPSASGCRASTI
jgi:CBS domain-containing protein